MDRNTKNPMICVNEIPSLSARRAWIEIFKIWYCGTSIGSLSARRAWIEIGCWLPDHSWWLVALRKESVDRNFLVYGT